MFIHFKHVASCLLMIITNLKKTLLHAPRDKISIFSIPALFYYSRFTGFSRVFHERKHPTSCIITGSVQLSATEKLPVVPFGFLLVSGEENVFSELFKNHVVNQRQRPQIRQGWFRKAKWSA